MAGGRIGDIFAINQWQLLSQIVRSSVNSPSYTGLHRLFYSWYTPLAKIEMSGFELSIALMKLAFEENTRWFHIAFLH